MGGATRLTLTTRLFVEIFIEADFDALPEERRRFALINIPPRFQRSRRRRSAKGCEISSCIFVSLREFGISY